MLQNCKKHKIAIVGSPNVGKSILFNKFGKGYSLVANYPHTTIAIMRKEASFAGKVFEIIDTPGIFSLQLFSEEGQVTRDILIKEHPDIILFCADATRLKQSLVLFSQILELEIPILFCLNMLDEASRKGLVMDTGALAKEIGFSVVETAAEHGIGLKELETLAHRVSTPVGRVFYPAFVENALEDLRGAISGERRFPKAVLLLYLTGDEDIARYVEETCGSEIFSRLSEHLRRIYRKSNPSNLKQAIAVVREDWVEGIVKKTVKGESFSQDGFSHKAAWASRHILWGWPILFGILWTTFFGVGTVATKLTEIVEDCFFSPIVQIVGQFISHPLLKEFVVGQYGILTMGVFNAVGTVVPILIVFFLITNFLEDVGYLSNLSVLSNRFLSFFGLTGKAVLPFVLGFGCNTVATLTSRILESKRERIIASILIALGIPCAVQLGVLLAIMATAPLSVLWITMTAVLGTQIICGLALNKLVPSSRRSDFIMELPNFNLPSPRHIILKTYYRVKWFLVEAVPMFVLGAGLMFLLEKTSLLALIKQILNPVVSGFLALPEKLTEVFILVLSRRELGAVYFKEMVDAGEVDFYQTIVGLVVITLFIPCVSNTMVMIKELGARWAVSANILIVLVAILVGGMVNALVRFFL